MIKTTRLQRLSLKELYKRRPLVGTSSGLKAPRDGEKPMTYWQFRRHVHPGWNCIIVPWMGMWIGIEKDGYTHS